MDATLVDADLRALASVEEDYLGEGEVLHLSEGRAVLRFPFGCFQQHPLGVEVRLTFRSTRGQDIHLVARLSAWRTATNSETCHFDVSAERDVVSRILSQRTDIRIFPDPTMPVAVTLRYAEDSWAKAVMRDLSLGGLGAMISREVELMMPRRDPVNVTFVLPGDPLPFTFRSEVRHCTLWGNAVLVGILFAEAMTGEMESEQHRIRKWCQTRHLQIQQRLREAQAG